MTDMIIIGLIGFVLGVLCGGASLTFQAMLEKSSKRKQNERDIISDVQIRLSSLERKKCECKPAQGNAGGGLGQGGCGGGDDPTRYPVGGAGSGP